MTNEAAAVMALQESVVKIHDEATVKMRAACKNYTETLEWPPPNMKAAPENIDFDKYEAKRLIMPLPTQDIDFVKVKPESFNDIIDQAYKGLIHLAEVYGAEYVDPCELFLKMEAFFIDGTMFSRAYKKKD